jgi:hypothetical protein
MTAVPTPKKTKEGQKNSPRPSGTLDSARMHRTSPSLLARTHTGEMEEGLEKLIPRTQRRLHLADTAWIY